MSGRGRGLGDAPDTGLPTVIARRTLELSPAVPARGPHTGRGPRVLDITVIEDTGGGRDCWLRVRNGDGLSVSQLRVLPDKLRAVAAELVALAKEIGA